ncbi:DEAD/DEAH box helicase [Desulfolithobacter sp.]
MPEKPSPVGEYVNALKNSDRFGPQVVAHRIFPAIDAGTAKNTRVLPGPLTSLLEAMGIPALYSHQAEAIELIQQGNDVLVSTPTASGKSLIYNLPVFAALLKDSQARALYLFPLKALAQDQARTITSLAEHLSVKTVFPQAICSIYDGDTTSHQRKKIRESLPSILITNPDMLHLSLLAYHEIWGHLFANLTHVIIDEVHTYRGVFGSHMAWVLRRLQRICRLYGADPVFVLSSATVGNPTELGRKLLGRHVQAVTRSGAPRGTRHVILLQPHDSAAGSATMLLDAALHRKLRTIVYTQSRKMTELITMWSSRRLQKRQQEQKIASYRAGFLPEDRRAIEEKLASGQLLGVISTSALELGINIGNLDICILAGYPGSIMATWQRAGRVGRAGQESLVVLIGQEDALDQHFMRHPDDFFQREVEPVTLNPDNRIIAGQHLVCAAAELPLTTYEPHLNTEHFSALLDKLTGQGALLRSADGTTWFAARKYPQREVDLRGSGARFHIFRQNNREPLGELDGLRALKECHPGAIYLHMARTWHVDSLDLEGREVLVRPVSVSYFTRPTTSKITEIIKVLDTAACGATRVHYGVLRVTETITGYARYLVGSQKMTGRYPLDLPPQIFETRGLWIDIPTWIQRRLEKQQMHFMGAIHALEHAVIGVMPLMVLCDRNDIGGIAHPFHEQAGGPAVFIYDGHAGGIGLSEKGFSGIQTLLEQACKTVSCCGCDRGCPSCVHSPKCGSGNRPIDKHACLHLLNLLLGPERKDEQNTRRPDTLPRSAQTLERASAKQNRPAVSSGHHPEKKRPDTQNTQDIQKIQKILPERWGVFDVETRLSAQEVGGWHRAHLMRISVAVLYDSRKDRYLHFTEERIDELIDHLFSLDLVVGFNNKRFDNRVLSYYTRKKLSSLPSFDILEEISAQLGYRLSLDRLAENTLGIQKSGNGLQALEWFRQGRMEILTRYCQKDVEITRNLFLFGLQQRYLLFRNKGGQVVRLPVQFENTIHRLVKDIPAP